MCVSVCAYVQGAEGQIRKCQSPHTLSQSFFHAEAILSLNTQKEGSTKDFLSQSTTFLKAIFSRNLKLWDVAHSNSCDNGTIHKSFNSCTSPFHFCWGKKDVDESGKYCG